jgi:F-type H+-transporting ATPase subunit epsilon
MASAIPETLAFELVSPERLLVSEPAEMVVVPGSEGDFGALPRHAPLISTVRPGLVDVYRDGKVARRIFVAGGFAEVNETRVTVLAEEAIAVADITSEMVEARLIAARLAVDTAPDPYHKASAAQALVVAEALRQAAAAAL